MKARLVVFPINGRQWCFSRSIGGSHFGNAHTPSTLKELWKTISFSINKPISANAEVTVDFISNKMNRAWLNLEKAPEGTFKNKIYSLGLRLLARVKPSEIFLRSITKDVSNVEILYPSSINARLVRRRLRHVAMRGTVIHRRYFYGSISLLPLTTTLTFLPLPNIPFFWVLFRAYSHWQAFKGSERLLKLVSDSSHAEKPSVGTAHNSGIAYENISWVLQPSIELKKLVERGDVEVGLSEICKTFDLNLKDVLRYRDAGVNF